MLDKDVAILESSCSHRSQSRRKDLSSLNGTLICTRSKVLQDNTHPNVWKKDAPRVVHSFFLPKEFLTRRRHPDKTPNRLNFFKKKKTDSHFWRTTWLSYSTSVLYFGCRGTGLRSSFPCANYKERTHCRQWEKPQNLKGPDSLPLHAIHQICVKYSPSCLWY